MSAPRPGGRLARLARLLGLAAPALLAAGCAGPDPAEHFAALQASLVSKGGLRTEIAPADAPYDRGDLERNFRLIAFRSEFPAAGDIIDEKPLSKWRGTITWRIVGDDRPSDHARMQALGARIEAATGLELREAEAAETPRMLIMYLSPEARPTMRNALAQRFPEALLEMFDTWASQLWVVCYATTYRGDDGPWTSGALIGIRDELPDLLRDSCLDEEVVQALGLPNDDASVRPSIFNDDEEFAFMTEHDADLLRILYDPRLKPGMTEAEAAPIVRRIVDEMDDVPPAPTGGRPLASAVARPSEPDHGARSPAPPGAPVGSAPRG